MLLMLSGTRPGLPPTICLSVPIGADGEIEISVGVGLAVESEMPPLAVERVETVAEHGLPQEIAIGTLLRRYAGIVRM